MFLITHMHLHIKYVHYVPPKITVVTNECKYQFEINPFLTLKTFNNDVLRITKSSGVYNIKCIINCNLKKSA
jgi:hypothetical protein